MADIYRTERFHLLWGQETTWGTPAYATSRFGLHDTATLADPDLGWVPFYGVGTDRNRDTILRGPWELRGSVPDIRLQSGTCGPVLALVLGRVAGGHVLEGLSSFDQRVPSFTMQADMRLTTGAYGLVRQYAGGKVARASIAAREGEDLRLNLEDLIFKDIAHNLTGTPKASGVGVGTDPGFNQSSRFMFAGATVTFGGIAICSLRDFNLGVDNQLTPRHYLCKSAGDPTNLTQVINDLQEGKRQYGLTVGIDVLSHQTDLTLFQYIMTQAANAGQVTAGFEVLATFSTTPGEGTGNLAIHMGVDGTRVNTVVAGGKINPPAPPAAVFGGDYTLNVSDVTIDLPTT